MTRRKGFTLLEMLLILAITALLGAVAVSKFDLSPSKNTNLYTSFTNHLYELQGSAMNDPSRHYQIYVDNQQHFYQFQSYPLLTENDVKIDKSQTFNFDSDQSILLAKNPSQSIFLIAFKSSGDPSEDVENCTSECLKIETQLLCINHLGRIYACDHDA